MSAVLNFTTLTGDSPHPLAVKRQSGRRSYGLGRAGPKLRAGRDRKTSLHFSGHRVPKDRNRAFFFSHRARDPSPGVYHFPHVASLSHKVRASRDISRRAEDKPTKITKPQLPDWTPNPRAPSPFFQYLRSLPTVFV